MDMRIVVREEEILRGTQGYRASIQRFCAGYYDYETGIGNTAEEAIRDLESRLHVNLYIIEEAIEMISFDRYCRNMKYSEGDEYE